MNRMDGVDGKRELGDTVGVKTSVSLPDDLFKRADRFARKQKKSRSQLYAEAIAEYLALHDADEITAALDRVCDATRSENDPAFFAASLRMLEKIDW